MGDEWKDLGKFTRKMDWWLPEERGACTVARLTGWILWGLRLGFILSNRISSRAPCAPGLG